MLIIIGVNVRIIIIFMVMLPRLQPFFCPLHRLILFALSGIARLFLTPPPPHRPTDHAPPKQHPALVEFREATVVTGSTLRVAHGRVRLKRAACTMCICQ